MATRSSPKGLFRFRVFSRHFIVTWFLDKKLEEKRFKKSTTDPKKQAFFPILLFFSDFLFLLVFLPY